MRSRLRKARSTRALSTTPESTPNRNYDLHKVEDVISPPFGPKFHTVKDTAGRFTLSESLLRVQALQCKPCSTPSRFDENITPISIPLQISAQGGVRSENTTPKGRAASLLAQPNWKPTPKIVATQKRLLLLHRTGDVDTTFPKRLGRLGRIANMLRFQNCGRANLVVLPSPDTKHVLLI